MYFTFKGEYSYDYGITVTRSMYRVGAPYRHYITEVDGISGGTMDVHGYTSPVMYLDFVVEGEENVLKIMGWLHGKGKYTDSTYPGKYLIVDFQSEKDFEYIGDNLYKTNFSAYMDDPFWYKEDDKWEEPWGKNLITKGWEDLKEYGGTQPSLVYNNSGSGRISKSVAEAKATREGDTLTLSHSDSVGYYAHIFSSQELAEIDNVVKDREYITVIKYESDVEQSLRLHMGGGNSYRYPTATGTTERGYWAQFNYEAEDTDVHPHIQVRGRHDFSIYGWAFVPSTSAAHYQIETSETGLTRILGWGGANQYKVIAYLPISSPGDVEQRHFRTYVRNSGVYPVRFTDLWGNQSTTEWIRPGAVGMYTFREHPKAANVYIVVPPEGYLDIEVGTPEVYYGDSDLPWTAGQYPNIYNSGTTTSQPLIRLIKKDDEIADVTINGVRFLYDFDGEDEVIIDCREQTAVNSKGVNRIQNLAIGHTFPYLEPGATPVISNTTIQFKKKDRWV